MPNPDQREIKYSLDTDDTVKRANLDQEELEAAGTDEKKRIEARQRKYTRDTVSSVERSNR